MFIHALYSSLTLWIHLIHYFSIHLPSSHHQSIIPVVHHQPPTLPIYWLLDPSLSHHQAFIRGHDRSPHTWFEGPSKFACKFIGVYTSANGSAIRLSYGISTHRWVTFPLSPSCRLLVLGVDILPGGVIRCICASLKALRWSGSEVLLFGAVYLLQIFSEILCKSLENTLCKANAKSMHFLLNICFSKFASHLGLNCAKGMQTRCTFWQKNTFTIFASPLHINCVKIMQNKRTIYAMC